MFEASACGRGAAWAIRRRFGFATWARTPLHIASEAGNVGALEVILQNTKNEVDIETFERCTALHLAAVHGWSECSLVRAPVVRKMTFLANAACGLDD